MKKISLKSLFWGAAIYHGFWLYVGSQLNSYDASTHCFFASHLIKHWFETWNTGWYGGFDQFTYPPLSHQIIALTGFILPIEKAYSVVQFFVLLYLFWGLQRYSSIWISKKCSYIAFAFGVLSSSVAQLTYQYGQFPMLFSSAFLLHSSTDFSHWLKSGKWPFGLSSVLALLVVFLSHHFAFTFGTLTFFFPVLMRNLSPDYKVQLKRVIMVIMAFGLLALPLGLEFFFFTSKSPMLQAVIPHGSRDNFLENLPSLIIFFLYPYGFLLLFGPVVFFKLSGKKDYRVLLTTALIMIVLGLGGTTPVSRWVLGPFFDLVTLDRFSFWAGLLLIPGLALVVEGFGKKGFQLLTILAFLTFQMVLIEVLFPVSLPQVANLDIQPVIQFLNSEDNNRYRYLTLGFGPKIGFVAAHTNASSIDGYYHFARPIPELRASGIEALDGADHYGGRGLQVLRGFLESPQKFKLGWVFSRGTDYDFLLASTGWTRFKKWEGITLWAHSEIPSLDAEDFISKSGHPRWVVLLWGASPFFFLCALLSQIGASVFQRRSCRGQIQSARPIQ